MLSAMLWYTRNGAVRVTHTPFSCSRVGSMSRPAGPAPLIPNRLWSAVASTLRPQPDSSMAWAIVTAAGTPYRCCAAIAADRVQGGAGKPGDHLDVPVEQYPVSRLRTVAVAQRVPAVMRPRIGQHRHHVRRRRVGLDPDVGPSVQRPRVGAAPGHPALLAPRPGAQREREAGEGGARLPVVGALAAAGLLWTRIPFRLLPGPRHP